MNEWTFTWWMLEQAMRRALGLGLAILGVVFLAGVLMGWPYGLMIGLLIVVLINLASRRSA